jgi:hypothetical protein
MQFKPTFMFWTNSNLVFTVVFEESKQWQLLENPLTLEVFSKSIKPSKEARHFGIEFPSHPCEMNMSSPPCRFYKLPCSIQFYDIPSMVCFLIIRYDISRFVAISFGISAYLLAGNTK